MGPSTGWCVETCRKQNLWSKNCIFVYISVFSFFRKKVIRTLKLILEGTYNGQYSCQKLFQSKLTYRRYMTTSIPQKVKMWYLFRKKAAYYGRFEGVPGTLNLKIWYCWKGNGSAQLWEWFPAGTHALVCAYDALYKFFWVSRYRIFCCILDSPLKSQGASPILKTNFESPSAAHYWHKKLLRSNLSLLRYVPKSTPKNYHLLKVKFWKSVHF